MPARFTLSKDKAGKFRFTLYAPNGQVVAESRTYATKASAMNGVASVRKNATIAAFEDATAASAGTRSAAKPAAKKATAKKATAGKATAAASARRTAKSATTTAKKAAKPATKPATRKPAARKAAPKPAPKPAAAPRKRVPTPRPAITV